MWAEKYLKDRSRESAEQLLQKIKDELPALKGLYTEDAIEGQQDEDLAWLFFVDGCALLYFIDKVAFSGPQELMIKVDELLIVRQDLLLLENQLPFQVLKLLSNDDELQWFSVINKFFIFGPFPPEGIDWMENNTTEEFRITVDQQPTHLLHHLRNELIKNNLHDEIIQGYREHYKPHTHRNIEELKAAGIQVKRNNKNAMHTHINFETSLYFWRRGRLYLSEFFVDGSTAPTLLNMIAFERCPDFRNNYEINSYVVFLDSLIDNVNDVKELRRAGVLFNMLGSDEEVAKLFNTISTDLVPYEEIYQEVREKMERHCRSKNKTRIAEARYKYFSNPWSFFALLAALTALILTFIQTWYAVYPNSPNA